MNSHEQYAALLDAFIDEALPETEAERVRTHLAVCPECQAYVSDALTMRELFPGVEETLVPDGFEEAVLSGLPPQDGVTKAKNRRTQARNAQTQAQNSVTQARDRRAQWQNGQWRTQWRKIALPLAACVTFVLLVGGILRGVPRPGGATENATFTAAGYDMDMDEAAPKNESDMEEAAPESAEEYGGVMDGAENMSAADMDMGGGAAFGDGMDGGAMPKSVTNGGAASGENTNTSGAAFKRTYETPEEPETEESAIFNTGINAPSFYYDSANLPEIPLLGASYDALTDSADAVPPQSAEGGTMPPQSDMIPAYTAESDTVSAQAAQGDTMPPQNVESDTVPQRNAETESAPDNGDAAPSVTESAPVPEPDENQRVSGVKSAAASSDDSVRKAAPDDVSMESAPESVGAEESVAVSFWTLSPDAAPMPELSQLLTQRPVSKKTASGVWYALEPEQFDALRENLPESAFTPLDPDSLPPDDAPPLRSRAPVYLFLPFPDSANP